MSPEQFAQLLSEIHAIRVVLSILTGVILSFTVFHQCRRK